MTIDKRVCVTCYVFGDEKVAPTKLLDGFPVCKPCYKTFGAKPGGVRGALQTAELVAK